MNCKNKKFFLSSGDMKMKDLTKQGNKSIDGLIGKCVAVKKKGCRK